MGAWIRVLDAGLPGVHEMVAYSATNNYQNYYNEHYSDHRNDLVCFWKRNYYNTFNKVNIFSVAVIVQFQTDA